MNAELVRWGPWSTLLGLGAAFGLAVAIALACRPRQRAANRLLAALLLVMVAKLMPYVLGFAGYFDAYRWLNFAPFHWTLALGPLLWLHVQARSRGKLPPRWGWHLLPAALQGLYYSVVFLQPVAAKEAWDDLVHARVVAPLLNVAWVLSLAVYLVAAWRLLRRDRGRFTGLRNLLLAMALLLAAHAAYDAATYAFALDYTQRFPLYVGLTVLVYGLGLEGWRHADQPYPAAPAPPRDWAAQGREWLARTVDAGWWRDPELTLDALARHLGTNSAYLSRAFNEGLQTNFSDAIGRQRVAWVQQQLATRDDAVDLLALGLEAGFSSKTTFNRVFKAVTGQTPSQFRAAARAKA